MKRAAIVQSSYIPWKGYFSLIQLADEFILYDDVQYTHRDWRSRNKIRTATGTLWLTIPVAIKGHSRQRVRDAIVSGDHWATKHWRTIEYTYRAAPYFDELAGDLTRLYQQAAAETHLSAINEIFLRAIAGWLEIPTRIRRSMDYVLEGDRNERLVNLCRQVGATDYLTGPKARAYLREEAFAEAGLRVRWMDYSGYPDYAQLPGPPCVHPVTILDLLFNLGRVGAARYLEDFRRAAVADGFLAPGREAATSATPTG